MEWPLFSKVKLKDVINKCSSLSTSGPDYVLWNHLKNILNNVKCCSNIVNIANTCINLSYWLTHFKKLLSIIIPKPNKPLYNIPKVSYSIVLLNMLGKLIEKAISSRIQVYSIVSNFIHSSQLRGIKQFSIIDTGIFLTHLIHIEWMKKLHTRTLVFNIV